MAQQPPVGPDLPTAEVSRPYSDAPHSVGLFRTSDQSVAETSTCPHTHKTHKRQNFHAPGRIRKHNPSKRVAPDPRLRPRGHWDRLNYICDIKILLKSAACLGPIESQSNLINKYKKGKEYCLKKKCGFEGKFNQPS